MLKWRKQTPEKGASLGTKFTTGESRTAARRKGGWKERSKDANKMRIGFQGATGM